MASFGGVVVSDLLASQFTQKELRSLKTEFESLGNNSSSITPKQLQEGLSSLAFLQQPLTPKEVASIVNDQGSSLDFEAFLSVCLELQKSGVNISPQKMASEFLRTSTTTLIHTVNDSEKKAYVDHINSYLLADPELSSFLPIDSSTDELFEAVNDGVLLCKLINVAVPGTIDERALNMKRNLNPWERSENHTLCLNSAKAIGCSVVNIGTGDLAAGKPHLVLGLLSQIVKIHLLSGVNLKAAPELAEMLNDTEDIEELLRLPAEKVLLKWVNYHLGKTGFSKEITNFSSDLKDGEAYIRLLNVLAPGFCDLSPLEIEEPYERAKAILANAERINCRKYLSPRDITAGSTNLNLAFLAYLFHERNGLLATDTNLTFAELLQDHEQDTREERAFRMWINSIGISTYVDQLFDNVWDGWILLEILDKLAPGSVNWKSANKPPIKTPFKKVENCNQAIDVARKMRLSLVNVAGTDIVQGNRKLILAFLWQLMRYHLLQLLKNIKLRGKEVSDDDILRWANNRVKRSGKDSRMESFKDRNLSTGVFFLDLLWSVEPRVLNWELVTKGQTDEEKKQNAVYVISVARKLGCSVFLLWDDIVEVRPKMILSLTASIMLWSLTEKARRAANTAVVLELHDENSFNSPE